ncbi:hypothetical protein HJC23_009163 [Cyclotella cryptica]|uniref:Uncharacterized protein n=1 Tax=Cyclotella cryptica TaxID=29204 RepID=A0ABD3PKT1_9STRA|eukprot:CCRYP_013770-RB/>CCRYP_013770-RB protein AED:0.39 eAED:0.39 QI:572/1/1/1/1/1/2/148/79
MDMDIIPQASFDDSCKLRILDPDTRDRSTALAQECQQFVSKVREFQVTVEAVLRDMNRIAESTEQQKLKAIGRRIKRDS